MKLGNHIVSDLLDCDLNILNDIVLLRKTMIEATIYGNATIINELFHMFEPYGISGILILAESHFSVHTWPEYNIASIDIYTCGNSADITAIYDYMKKVLNPKKENIKIFTREIE